jgi:hypothetical protein
MQTYKARYEQGRVVPIGEPVIPEGSELIVTVLPLPGSTPVTDSLLGILKDSGISSADDIKVMRTGV